MSTLILSESQRKLLIIESVANDIEKVKNHSENLVDKIYKDVKGSLSLDFKLLLTWSSAIGGFLTPLSQLIDGQMPELSSTDKSLILIGVIFSVIFQNAENFKKIKESLKEKGLYDNFLIVKEKASDLKSTFLNFLNGLNITVNTMSGIIAYSFLIPIIPILLQIATTHSVSNDEIIELSKRVAAWGLTIVSSKTLKNIFDKIFKKFN